MSTALYRLYRPQKFSEVEGQPSAVDVLIKSISTGRTAHAYLFSGARGCGKTTVARLVAKALNCTSPIDNYEPCCKCSNCISITNGENLDVVEIDGASNNGVEEIRELKSHVSLAPFNSRFKVYIIDEVHMLSTAAFNALLKTLEEPPEYVVFILATTEPHKIPVTIRSRCQHIPFHRINTFDILHRLEHVCKAENLEYEIEALSEIARQADGALRDALSMLDQVMSFGKGIILLDDVSALIGGGSLVALQRWLSLWRAGGEESFLKLNEMFQRGASAQRVLEELFYITRNLWVAREFGNECVNNAGISKEEYDYAVDECNLWDSKSLEQLMMFLIKLMPQARAGMRTDVIVGILMSRRSEILNAEENTNDNDHKVVEKKEPKLNAPIERKTASNPVTQKNSVKNESDESKEVKTADNEIPLVTQDSNIAKTVGSETPSAIQDSIITKTDDNPSSLSDSSIIDMEKFSPLDEKIKEKVLLDLKSNEFALFCAMFDSELLYSLEQNKVCIIVKQNYLFYFLSNDRNSLILTKMLRTEYPECRINIACGEKLFEYSEVSTSIKKAAKETDKIKSKTPAADPTEINNLTELSETVNTEKSSSLLYDASHNAMKFMSGEIVMHRVTSDKPEELDVL